MRPIHKEKRPAPGWSKPLQGTSNNPSPKPRLAVRQAYLNGALDFLVFWHDHAQSVIDRAQDGDLEALLDAEVEATAWLHAVAAFKDWAAAS